MSVKDKVRSTILSRTTEKVNQKVGIELETIIHTNEHARLSVNEEGTFSSVDLLALLSNKQDDNGSYSLEPGGQLEWASPPFVDLNDLNLSIELFYDQLDSVLSSKKLTLINYALDPKFSPDEVGLINQKKYQLMDDHMIQSGSMGRWMMRNTASIQINFDTTDAKNMEEIAFVSDCIHPVASYLFANSPFKNSNLTGAQNVRQIIWQETDRWRCGNLFDHEIYSSNSLIDQYIDYIMKVPNIFKLDRFGNYSKGQSTIGERLIKLDQSDKLKERDINSALHQIFTNVRLKSLVEIRGADRTPKGFEIAPAAFWVGLLLSDEIREEAHSIVKCWSQKDRTAFNNCAFSLDLEQEGPLEESYGYWINLFSELSIRGLVNRGLNEEKYFEDFHGRVLDHGPFSLQIQSYESKNHS
tara:strand:- start:5825 stop:7063 length:1239 start_codon:yes stop_codon:yes gene_type:complete